MKKLFTLISLALSSQLSFSQNEPFLPDTNALEGIIVEKYYVTGADDVAGGIPEGAITYRVYADLKPDYKFLNYTAFSVHPISIRVSNGGEFYNNGFGTTFGANLNPAFLTIDPLVGIDSWLAAGGATDEGLGILKSLDEDDSSILADSPTGYLFNEDGFCPPSLQDQDGIVNGEVPSVNSLGLDTDQLPIFGTENSSENFEVNDITVGVLGGTLGVGDENLVLLGQFTTIDGVLEFDINIQIGIPEDLQCDVIPSCEKNSIWFTYSFDPQDSEDNQNPDLNYVIYQNETLSYVDDGAPCTVGTDELTKLDNAFSLYPNPTEGSTQILFSELLTNARYEIFDMSGKLVKSQNMGTASPGTVLEIDMKAFRSGVYLIKVISDGSYSIKKLVKR